MWGLGKAKPTKEDIIKNMESLFKCVYQRRNNMRDEYFGLINIEIKNYDSKTAYYEATKQAGDECFFFVLWELDMQMHSIGYDDKARQQIFEFLLTKTSGGGFFMFGSDLEAANKRFDDAAYKRLEEYAEGYNASNGKIGSPADRVLNYFVDNVKYALENKRYYIADGIRPYGLHGDSEMFTIGMWLLGIHARLTSYFLTLAGKRGVFLNVTPEEFEKLIKKADVSEKVFKDELSEM